MAKGACGSCPRHHSVEAGAASGCILRRSHLSCPPHRWLPVKLGRGIFLQEGLRDRRTILFSSARYGRTAWCGLPQRHYFYALVIAAFSASCGAGAAGPGNKPRIAFAGDSIVDNYWAGVTRNIEANSCLKGAVELGRFARNATGLTRGDRVYWPREVRRIGDHFMPALFVLSIGLNDRQFIVDGNGARTAWGAPNWSDKYRQELEEFLKGAVAKKATVLLIGLPVMRSEVDNADVNEKNGMFIEAVNKLADPHLHYVEPWKLKATGPDVFASYGADKNGKMVQIRTSDGQHFTAGGEDLVAAYLFPKIVAALDESGIASRAMHQQADDDRALIALFRAADISVVNANAISHY